MVCFLLCKENDFNYVLSFILLVKFHLFENMLDKSKPSPANQERVKTAIPPAEISSYNTFKIFPQAHSFKRIISIINISPSRRKKYVLENVSYFVIEKPKWFS